LEAKPGDLPLDVSEMSDMSDHFIRT